MTGEELEAILRLPGFQRGLEEIGADWAHKNERPIVNLVAKILEGQGRACQVEANHCDLLVDRRTHVEFKIHLDCDMAVLEREWRRYGDQPLTVMWKDAQAGRVSKSWCVMPLIYGDTCLGKDHKSRPDMFIWIIWSRDLRGVPLDHPQPICCEERQRTWNLQGHPCLHPANLKPATRLLQKLSREERLCSIRDVPIRADVGFPSIYHFIICDFSHPEASPAAEREVQQVSPEPSAEIAPHTVQPKIPTKSESAGATETASIPGGKLTPSIGPQDKYALVASYIKQNHSGWSVGPPSQGNLPVTDLTTRKSVSFDVRFSQDKLQKHCERYHMALGNHLMAMGWWSFQKQDLQNSRADFCVFVLPSLSEQKTSFIIIPPRDLLQRLQPVRGHIENRIDLYLWVTKMGRCWETRNLSRDFDRPIDNGTYSNTARDFSTFLNAWHLVAARLR